MNLDKWNKLDAEDQKIFAEVINAEVINRVQGAEAEDMEYLKKLEEEGLTVVDLADTPERLSEARDECRECWTELDDLIGKEWMDKIREHVGVKN